MIKSRDIEAGQALLDDFKVIPFDISRKHAAQKLKAAIANFENVAPIGDVICHLELALGDLKDKQIIAKYEKENNK